ncbi:MAG: hypothetical protein KAI40_02335 [Desulfobacterales bacterium]|nr:hypothetical protein [Desulfobacterales bacterium]
MTGETDLKKLLASMVPCVFPDEYIFVQAEKVAIAIQSLKELCNGEQN